MAKTYSASMLKVLEGLDAVRMRPGMYIGSTGSRGLHHLLWEIVDNAIDEVANGYARSISVELHKDGNAYRGGRRLRRSGRYPSGIGHHGRGGDLHPAARGRQIRSSEFMRIPAACTASARRSSTR